MFPRKAIQSEEKTARFISLVVILRATKLFSCIHVIDKNGGFPCNKDEAKAVLTHFCSTPRYYRSYSTPNKRKMATVMATVLLVPEAYSLDFSASHLTEMRKPWYSHFRFQRQQR